MKYLISSLLGASLSLSLLSGLNLETTSHAESATYARSNSKISRDLIEKVNKGHGDDRVRVIVQPRGGWDSNLDSTVESSGGSDVRRFRNFPIRVLTLPASAAVALASRDDVSYVSLNREVRTLGHLSATTGADQIRSSSGTNTSGLDGTGIGIAVLDSGIDTTHRAFLDRSNNVRVVYSEDFTGEGRTDDPYGHGTHVASLAAGNGRISNSQYVGIAPNATLINLRVLNSQGVGTTAGVLRALDWVETYRTQFNIRVVNLSLGMPAIDSYRTDPICRAVRRLVNLGLVVAAAAGNNGIGSNGEKIYGHIHSPGNEPSAITVGASNTFGTNPRQDDGVTSFSSRGPTRSFWTDENGIRHYDNLIKPDLVAPGNRLVEAQSNQNLLVTLHPELDAGISPVDNRKMMYLNGTSMATPVVAGAAALMLQANPTLTPNLVKALLMYTAQPLAGFNMLEQGSGQLNIAGAVQLASLVRTDLTSSTPVGSSLLIVDAVPAAETTIAGQSFTWSRGIVLNYTYATGVDLITKYQGVYRIGSLLSDGVITGDGIITGDLELISDGIITGDHILISSGIITGDGLVFLHVSTLFSDSLEEGLYLPDGIITGDGVITGDGIITGDLVMQAQSATLNGDETSTMAVEVDDGNDCLDY